MCSSSRFTETVRTSMQVDLPALFLVIQLKSRTHKGERSLSAFAATQRARSEIRLEGILWLNDARFQAKCDCKMETGSEIPAQAMKKSRCASGCFCSSLLFLLISLDFRIQ